MKKKPPLVPPGYDEGAYGASLVARSLPVTQVQALTPAENKPAEAQFAGAWSCRRGSRPRRRKRALLASSAARPFARLRLGPG